MINDLDETLKQLLVKKAGLALAEVDISFDTPTRDWSAPVTRPTINLYLFDLRENLTLRETYWDGEETEQGRVNLKRRPLRIDLSYMVTCWTSGIEDQHRLLWRVLETLFRYSPLPDDVLQGDLRLLTHPVRTEVAQPDGVFKNVSDFWGALENQLRPSVALIVTLDLDLDQIASHPLVLARSLKFGQARVSQDEPGNEMLLPFLEQGWEPAPVRVGGEVRNKKGEKLAGAWLRLVIQPVGTPAEKKGAPAVQFGSAVRTNTAGRYVFPAVPPGEYILEVRPEGLPPDQPPYKQPLSVMVSERGSPVPGLVFPVEVPM